MSTHETAPSAADAYDSDHAHGHDHGHAHEHQAVHQRVASPSALIMNRTMAHSGTYGSDHESDDVAEEEADRVFPHLPAFEQQFPGSNGVNVDSSHSFSPRTPVNTPMVWTTKHTPSQSYSHSHMNANRRARSGSQSSDHLFQLERTFEHSLELDVKLACLFSPREQLTDGFSIHNVLSFSPPPPPPPSPTLGFRHGSAGNATGFMEGLSFGSSQGRSRLDLGMVAQPSVGN